MSHLEGVSTGSQMVELSSSPASQALCCVRAAREPSQERGTDSVLTFRKALTGLQ